MKPAFKDLKIKLYSIAVGIVLGALTAAGISSDNVRYSKIGAYHGKVAPQVFNRIASFPVFENTSVNLETAAEIVAASKDGTPIPWSAPSGLAVDTKYPGKAYTIHDSFFRKSRICTMNTWHKPAIITGEIVLDDAMGKLAAVDPLLVNGDGDATVNLDPEGIATRKGCGFWIAPEGRGTVGDTDRPFETLNLLAKVSKSGLIEDIVTLPDSVNTRQVRFGFEGVTRIGYGANETLFVAFQREWADDPANQVRIGRYEVATGEWSFYCYPLEMPQSANDGWVGLSEIAHLCGNEFVVIERDNQGGADAVIKRIYRFSIAGLTPLVDPAAGSPAFSGGKQNPGS